MDTTADDYVEVYLLPHIRKYLLRKLNPASAPTSPNAAQMQRELVEMLPLRVLECEPQPDKGRPIQRLRLRLKLPDLYSVGPQVAAKLNRWAESWFRTEFVETVDRLVYRPPHMEKQTAIAFFRDQYGITEEDLKMDTSRIQYYKYEAQQRDRRMTMGGKRSRSGPLPTKESTWRRRRERRRT